MKILRRSAFGWPATRAPSAPCRNGMVAHYNGGPTGLSESAPHSKCVAYWKNVRRWHLGRGWIDIGYSYGVCPHSFVFEGRGFGRAQAAQPGGNTTWTSCTFMIGGKERPSAGQIRAWRELRAWLRGKGLAKAVRGHRQFISTSCPGSIINGMVRDGTLSKGPSAASTPPEEDDVPTYVSIDKTGQSRQELLVGGEWHQIYFDQNNSKEASGHHADGDWPSLLKGACTYSGHVTLRLTGLPKGVEGQARTIEVVKEGDDWKIQDRDFPVEFCGSHGDTFVTVPADGFVPAGQRLRVEVVHFGGPEMIAKVIAGQVRLQVWER